MAPGLHGRWQWERAVGVVASGSALYTKQVSPSSHSQSGVAMEFSVLCSRWRSDSNSIHFICRDGKARSPNLFSPRGRWDRQSRAGRSSSGRERGRGFVTRAPRSMGGSSFLCLRGSACSEAPAERSAEPGCTWALGAVIQACVWLIKRRGSYTGN